LAVDGSSRWSYVGAAHARIDRSRFPRAIPLQKEARLVKDLTISLPNQPGALARMGEALGRAGVSIEGGGAFVVNGVGVAHFLVANGPAARAALEAANISVLDVREVLVQRLNQDEPGQLGKLTRRMADAGVNIETLYSDHDHNLILTVDNEARGREVSEQWERDRIERQLLREKGNHENA
jgi:hypothetical protein